MASDIRIKDSISPQRPNLQTKGFLNRLQTLWKNHRKRSIILPYNKQIQPIPRRKRYHFLTRKPSFKNRNRNKNFAFCPLRNKRLLKNQKKKFKRRNKSLQEGRPTHRKSPVGSTEIVCYQEAYNRYNLILIFPLVEHFIHYDCLK